MSFAKNTPIQYLPGIGWRTANVLNDLGVHTAGQLRQIPERVLVELFGPSIMRVVENVHVDSRISLHESESHRYHIKTNSKKTLRERMQLAAQFVSVL